MILLARAVVTGRVRFVSVVQVTLIMCALILITWAMVAVVVVVVLLSAQFASRIYSLLVEKAKTC